MQARWLAGCAAVVLLLVALIWGLAVLVVTGSNFGEYCEDAGAACDPGEPVLSAFLAAVGIVGLAAALSIVSRLLFYALDELPPERLAIRAAVMLSSAAVWSTVVLAADLRGAP